MNLSKPQTPYGNAGRRAPRGTDSGPLISVICPVYNTGPYLPRCVDSVLNQTYSDFELVLVDDCSSDGSGELCAQYKNRDSRIRTIFHEKNSGVAAARNTGLKNARGRCIAWVDSDDWADRDWLEIMVNRMAEHDADISIIGTRNIYDGNKFSGTSPAAPPRARGSLAGECGEIFEFGAEEGLANLVEQKYINNGLMDKLFKKELFSGLFFPEGRKFEDSAVMHTLISRAKKIVFDSAKKYNYFYRLGSITHRHSIENEYERFLADRDRLDFFSSLGNRELYEKQLAVAFQDALMIQEMGFFRANTDREKDLAAGVLLWAENVINSREKDRLPREALKRFRRNNGNPLYKLSSFLKYELRSRLRYFVLSRLPDKAVSLIRDLKRL